MAHIMQSLIGTNQNRYYAVYHCKMPKGSGKGIQIPCLLYLDSQVTLVRQSYFNEHLLPKVNASYGERAEAH